METITRTDRLLLIPLSTANVEEAHKVYGDSRIWTHRPNARHMDIRTTRALAEVASNSWSEHQLGPWSAYYRDRPSKFLGVGGAEFVDGAGGFWDIKYRLLPEHWGQGIATELTKQAIESARRVHPDAPITIRVTTNHPASSRIAEKLGLEKMWEGRRIGTEDNPDEPDVRVYADRQLSAEVLEFIQQRP